MYKHINNLLTARNAAALADTLYYIDRGYMTHWAPQHQITGDRGLQQYSTATRWEQYQNGKIDRAAAVQYAQARARKQAEKQLAADRARLAQIAAAPALDWIEITVDWVRSSTWGANPHATAYTATATTRGTASGCGYDKRSAAVAQALNANPAAVRILCDFKETALAAGASDARRDACTGCSNAEIIGYGAGYNTIPAFESGVGVDCFWAILRKAGYTVIANERARRADTYTITKEG